MAAKRLHIYREKKKTGRWLWVLLPAALLAALSLWWGYEARRPSHPRTVEILLLSGEGKPLTGEPVAGPVDTAALPIGSWGAESVSTGADGRCRFEGVPPGSYWLRAADNLYELRIPENAPETVPFSLSAGPDRYTAVLRLQSADGEPVARRRVTLLETELEKPAEVSYSHVIEGETDWQGNLVLEGLRAGGHLVCPESAAPIPFILEPGEKKTVSAQLTAYPAPEQPLTERVRFCGTNGRPLPDEPVMQVLYGTPGGREIALYEWRTDENGELALSLSSPGAYTLRIRGRRYKLEARGEQGVTVFYL